MEPRHSTSSPLPSRAILMLGALGFVCLTLLALLALQLTSSESVQGPPALDAVAVEAPERIGTTPRQAEAPDTSAPPTVAAAAPAVPFEMQPSLENAFDEPVLAELLAFFDAVHVAFGTEGARLASPLQPYFNDLVQRLELDPEGYRITLRAPTLDVADRRATSLQALFLDAGLSADVLTLTGHTGSDGVVVERS